MELELVHVGRYTRQETFSQRAIYAHIGLCLAGLEYIHYHPPGGGEALRLGSGDVPYLGLCPPGVRADFSFTRARENWVIQCRMPELEDVEGECRARLGRGDAAFSAPYAKPLTTERATVLRERFERIQRLWQSGIPSNVAAAGWMSAAVIGELIAEENPGAVVDEPSAAARLRTRIDADIGFRRTLAELSREAGASAGYSRRRFVEEFGIEPGEYRSRRRLARILELIDRGGLSPKEVAARVGMRHVTHFHRFVRQRCGVTPGELVRQRGRRERRERPDPYDS